MSTRQAPQPPTPVRRVREQARDVLVVMAFSALASTALAAALLLVLSLGR